MFKVGDRVRYTADIEQLHNETGDESLETYDDVDGLVGEVIAHERDTYKICFNSKLRGPIIKTDIFEFELTRVVEPKNHLPSWW